MDIKGFKVKGLVLLDMCGCKGRQVVKTRTISVLGTPAGLMVGSFKHHGVTCYAVKAEGENFTDWYQVGCSFPGMGR